MDKSFLAYYPTMPKASCVTSLRKCSLLKKHKLLMGAIFSIKRLLPVITKSQNPVLAENGDLSRSLWLGPSPAGTPRAGAHPHILVAFADPQG